jgi:hypothetical protein
LIEDQWLQSDCLLYLVNKTNEIEKKFEITYLIHDSNIQSEAFLLIIHKINDIPKALDITTLIKNSSTKSKSIKFILNQTKEPLILKQLLELTNTLEEDHKVELLNIIENKDENHQFYDDELKIASNIHNKEAKAKALSSIVEVTDDLNKALELAELIQENDSKDKAIESIIERTQNLEDAIKLTDKIDNEEEKAKALLSIEQKSCDKKLYEQVITIAKDINNDWVRSEIFLNFTRKCDDLQRALEFTQLIKVETMKVRAIVSIIKRTEKEDILNECFNMIEAFIDDTNKIKVLNSLAKLPLNFFILEKALIVAQTINSFDEKAKILPVLLQDIENLDDTLEIINKIKDDWTKELALAVAIQKTDKNNFIEKEVEIANTISNKECKGEAVYHIVSEIDDIDESLKLASSIEDEWEKSEALFLIIQKLTNFNLAFEIINSIPKEQVQENSIKYILQNTENLTILHQILEFSKNFNDEKLKVEIYQLLVEKSKDKSLLEDILKLSCKIQDEWDKLDCVLLVIKKMDEVLLEFEIIKNIKEDWIKARVLYAIIDQIEDDSLLESAFNVAQTIANKEEQDEVLYAIVKNYHKLTRALEITQTIDDKWSKAGAQLSIVKRIDNFEYALSLANGIDKYCNDYKEEAMLSIIQKLDNSLEALKLISTLTQERLIIKAITSLLNKTQTNQIYLEILNLIKTIENDDAKFEILYSIESVNSSDNLLNYKLQIIDLIQDTGVKAEAYLSVIDMLQDLEQALDIIESIEDEWTKAKLLSSVISRLDDKTIFDKTIEIIHLFQNDDLKGNLLKELIINKHII